MTEPNRLSRLATRGFTLVEVMIVILIVLALGGLVAYNLMGKKEEADNKIVQIDMNTLKRALKDFRITHGRYPSDEEGISVLWNKEASSDEEVVKKWTKLLEEPKPKDAYGNEWGYRQKSEHSEEDIFDLWSVGRDKMEGTEDDITSWAKEGEEDGGATGGGSDGGGSGKSGG